MCFTLFSLYGVNWIEDASVCILNPSRSVQPFYIGAVCKCGYQDCHHAQGSGNMSLIH